MYRVDFWDMIDGWCAAGFPEGFDKTREFADKNQAIEKCKEMQEKNPPNSAGEHYGVIDLDLGIEVFCGLNWWRREHREGSI